ncbi:MAG: hypothetical protein ABSF28_05885 [Terracidiphilus sp.]
MSLFGSLFLRHDYKDDRRRNDSQEEGESSGENGGHFQNADCLCLREGVQPSERFIGQPCEEIEDQGKAKGRDKEGSGETEEESFTIIDIIGFERLTAYHARSVTRV